MPCFNSLQVDYQHDWIKEVALTLPGFNSLQVDYQQVGCGCSDVEKWLFQFLIGRLSTKTIDWSEIAPHEGFNSLQVDYQPFEQALFQQSICQFQFLIGRLSTQNCMTVLWLKRPVSIPYRQTINCKDRQANRRRCSLVSIPYRQTINNIWPMWTYMIATSVSIPYRQTINQKSLCMAILRYLVSIPYRQTINLAQQIRNLIHHYVVSIPYRQTINQYKGVYTQLHFIKVSIPYRQTINKDYSLISGIDYICFNSLQVDYQRCCIFGYLTYIFQFQFLIGRLSTSIKIDYKGNYRAVSIPYRQTINRQTKTRRILQKEEVSIPYRQTINNSFSSAIFSFTSSFNSLQVDYQRCRDDRQF